MPHASFIGDLICKLSPSRRVEKGFLDGILVPYMKPESDSGSRQAHVSIAILLLTFLSYKKQVLVDLAPQCRAGGPCACRVRTTKQCHMGKASSSTPKMPQVR